MAASANLHFLKNKGRSSGSVFLG